METWAEVAHDLVTMVIKPTAQAANAAGRKQAIEEHKLDDGCGCPNCCNALDKCVCEQW